MSAQEEVLVTSEDTTVAEGERDASLKGPVRGIKPA